MNHISHVAVLAAISAGGVLQARSEVVINEIMQSNIDCVYVDNEYPDSWVELYNTGADDVSLGGWRIGVNESPGSCYVIPEPTEIKAGGYILVYCDKSETGGLHTPFRLESGKGGAVYLYDAAGRLADSLTDLKKMPAPNVAYGRVRDGGEDWRYMVSATPGASNSLTSGTLKSKDDVQPDPLFSHDSFVSVQGAGAFTLTVSKPEGTTASSRLCVTTDGREPVESDAVVGDSWSMDVSDNTVVRARLLSSDRLPVRSAVRSYIYLPEASDLRVVSFVGDPDDFYDATKGILSGAEFSYTMTPEEVEVSNWNYKWRRPVNVEYFTANDHSPVINQLGETRVHGGVSRRYPQKSLTVYANKRFGTKRYDTSDFWPDKPEVTVSKSFVVRNGGNMFICTRINDALAQALIGRGNPAVDRQSYSPCIYFLNGRYMGIGDLRERSNEDFIAANYTDAAGDELEDIDMIENWEEVKAGSIDALMEFQQWYNGRDVTFDGLNERMDVDNFIDQLVVQWFGGNGDFFNNNIICWRPTAADGRWRWVLKDLDQFANTLNLNVSQHGDYYEYAEAFYRLNPRRHRLFRLFYEELPEARERFVDRMLVCLGDVFQHSAVKGLVEEFVGEIADEYPRHLARYFSEEDAAAQMGGWIGGFAGGTRYIANDWVVSRCANVLGQLESHYGLSGRIYTHVVRRDESAPVRIQGYGLMSPGFDGIWFAGREIRLATDPGYTIKMVRNGQYAGEYGTELAFTPDASTSSLDFYVDRDDSSAIDSVEADAGAAAPVEYFNLQGLRVDHPTSGLYIKKQGSRTAKVRL